MSSKLKQIFYGLDNYSKKIRDILFTIGRNKIIDIYIYRSPIQKMIKSFLNVVSFNQIEDNLKKYNYDDIYHLYLIVKTNNNYVLIEKNEIVNIQIIDINDINNKYKVEKIKIDYNDNLTLIDLLNNTLNKIKSYNFFNYDSRNLNCQKFILDILTSNNLMKNQYYNFIYQNPYEIYENTGILSSFNKVITNIGSTYKIIKGEGLNKKIINDDEFNELIKTRKFILSQITININYFKKNEKELLDKLKENNINVDNYNYNIVNKKIKNIIFYNNIKDKKINYDVYLMKDYNKYITFLYFLSF
jgi:hypothetical protein